MSRNPDDNDRYALYEHAHHDLWWAKAQQWNVANWALLLIAAIVAVTRTLISDNRLKAAHTWPFIVVNGLVAIMANWYLARLHQDVVHNRDVYRFLEERTGIKTLRSELRTEGLEKADEGTDRTRGIEVLYVMAGVFSVATGFSAYLLGAPAQVAFITALVVAFTGAFFLGRAA